MKVGYVTLLALTLFILLPLLYLITNPGDLSQLNDHEVINAFKTTILAGIIATIIGLILSLPSGYILARKDFRFKSFVEAILDLPMAIPHSVIGIMLLSFIYGISFFDWLREYIVDNFWGIVIVYLFVGLPFLINSIRDGFILIDEEIENVAKTLGASEFRIFFDILLPLIKNNIISGSILCFARGVSEVGAILIIAYYPKTVPILILERFLSFGLLASKPISVAMVIVCLILFTVLRRVK
ncbi:binding-protein-dependent transport systems inner membrane component [Methanocaldococcus villosus KIN24-T80]|uniref:Binding-protein-dependent transport systems inner membrane component n=1 Tax=Methanocaldococcus villosus KIN24-T80 TaxID=1069083 RepID=N6V0D7_9EURY|nr:ABC transporter permease [Methanocaldococcus villosus]ENN95788.1 binding-protein-dependent transport systems inner membrane component [Methanocaldococcus villosus KIN24-T80]